MVRFAGQMLRRKGYSRNLAFDGRVNGEHKESFRVSLLLRPIEALENYTIYENTDIDENGNAQIFSDFTPTHPLAGQMAMLLNQQQARGVRKLATRSEEHTSELQSLMRSSYAVFSLKKKKNTLHQKLKLRSHTETITKSPHTK